MTNTHFTDNLILEDKYYGEYIGYALEESSKRRWCD